MTIEKRKIPGFRRQDSHKKPKLGTKWRSARGLQSKVRLAKMGYLKKPKIGYGQPKIIRGKHPSGLNSIEVSTLKELKTIQKGDGIIIKTIGLKKKILIIKEAIKNKITILNVKNPEKFVTDVENKIKQKKEEKKEKAAKKETSKVETKKKAKEKEQEKKKEEKKEKSEDEIKEDKKKEDQEKNKILTSKDQ